MGYLYLLLLKGVEKRGRKGERRGEEERRGEGGREFVPCSRKKKKSRRLCLDRSFARARRGRKHACSSG